MSGSGGRVAIVGLGIETALGNEPTRVFERLCANESGVDALELFDAAGQRSTRVGEIRELRTGALAREPGRGSPSRCDALGVAAASRAMSPLASLKGSLRVGIAVGATTGGMFEAESVLVSGEGAEAMRASAHRLLTYPLSTTAWRIAEHLGASSRVMTVCSACSSGAVAIALGAMWLGERAVDCVVAGGVDGLSRLTLTGFNALGATTTDVCRPFDVGRAGLVLGEGAGFVALLRESTARRCGCDVLAWLSGWAVGAEAHHITHPCPTGRIPVSLMRDALRRAGLAARDIDFVNCHGTGTPANDAMEARAIAAVLGPYTANPSVSSSKAQLGHTLAAAGAIEAVITVEALKHQCVPPTGGLVEPDPESRLRHVTERPERRRIDAALSNSFGFGGSGCVLAFEHRGAAPRNGDSGRAVNLVVSAAAAVVSDRVLTGAELLRLLDGAGLGAKLAFEPLSRLAPERSRRFDRLSAITAIGVAELLLASGLAPDGVGLACGSAYGNVQRSVEFLKRAQRLGPGLANPAEFPHLLPSAPAGNASVYCGLTGPVATLADLDTSTECAWQFALSCVAGELSGAMVAGGAELLDPYVTELLAPIHGTAASERGEGGAWALVETESSAMSRGRAALVYVGARGQISGRGLGAADLPEPRTRAEGRAVVASGAGESIDAPIDWGAWAQAAHYSLAASLGDHEAKGALALAAAVGLLQERRAREVLVVRRSSRQSHWFVLYIPGER